MTNLDSITNENNKKWSYIPDHPYRILILGGSGSGKTNALLNLLNEQHDIDKMYVYARDLNKPKYQFLIKTCEDVGIKHVNNLNTFIVCQNINDYNPSRKRKKLIYFDDTIADIMMSATLRAIIKELFIRCRKLNISLAFITQSYFSIFLIFPKDVRLNLTHYFIMKIKNREELQNIAFNHFAEIDYDDCKKTYRECTKEPFTFLTIDTTLPPSNPLRFRKNLLESL